MASAGKRQAILGLLTVFSTSVLLWFGNGLQPIWPLVWFAPLPVLLFALETSWPSAMGAAFLAWLLGCLNLWHYLHVLHVPGWVWLAAFGSEAVAFSLCVLLFRALLRRKAVWSALLSFPAGMVSLEFIRNLTSVHGTGGSLAYSQLKFLPFLQFASIAGPWGMSFLLFLFPATLAVCLYLRKAAPGQALRILSGGLGLIVLVLLFGFARLASPASGSRVMVGLIASDEPGNVDVPDAGADADRLFHDYALQAEKLAAQGARAIVIPEKLAVVTDSTLEGTNAIFQAISDKTGAVVVVGVVRVSPPKKYNRALIYSPGTQSRSYDKHHMLPPFESALEPGRGLMLLEEPADKWGVAICKDMDFTPLSRQYGDANVGLMLVPGWDFVLDGSWHGHMAIMRGVEDGFSIVRAAKQGYLTVSDDRGRILAETRSDSAPFATLLAEVPSGHDKAIYLTLGDWAGWFATILLIFALLQLWRYRDPTT